MSQKSPKARIASQGYTKTNSSKGNIKVRRCLLGGVNVGVVEVNQKLEIGGFDAKRNETNTTRGSKKEKRGLHDGVGG